MFHHAFAFLRVADIDFAPVFRVLYPINAYTGSHGIRIRWEVQLIHPEYVDQELIGPGNAFEWEDFLPA